ncbi:glycoside hydrolase superfamily, partial [Gaertneriomyces semiglobifer]
MGTGLRFSQREYDILHSVADLKRKFPKLKVILAIGGWDFSESDATKHIFTLAFATKQSRTYLIDSIVQQMQNLNLDGVDLDYEYPSAMERQAPPSDTKDFALFLDELRARVGDRKLITVAVPAGFWFLKGFDVDNIVKNCDFINVMNYDYNGPWNAGPAGKWDQTAYYKTAPHTGMKQIRESTELLIRAKVPLSKVNIGLGFYGLWSNMEISRVIEGGIVTGRYDPDSQTKWFNYQGDQITYDDRETIAQKVAFAKSAGFGGSMVWSLD